MLVPAPPTNRLAREKSPYLLQHQPQSGGLVPVGRGGLRPRPPGRTNRSSSASAIPPATGATSWSGNRSRTPDIAAFLNAHFVSIKVDREERPDVDKIYMTTAQAMTGQGGWPLNCFLTPDLKPFYAGTYFPPEGKYGQPGFLQVLRQIAKLWQSSREKVLDSAEDFHGRLAGFVLPQPGRRRARARSAGQRRRQVQAGIRSPTRRFRRRAQVSAPKPAGLSPAPRRPRRGCRGGANGPAHLRCHGGGRHPRSTRRRLCPLLRGRPMARPAF